MKRISLLALTLFLTLILSQVFSQKEITLEDIWTKGTFRQESIYGLKSMNDGAHYTTLDKTDDRKGQEINKYQYKNGKKTATILSSSELNTASNGKSIKIDSYSFSADESKVLIKTNTEHIYRHSTKEQAYIYDLKTKKLTPVANSQKHRYATFSPDGSKIAYVMHNNLFYTDLNTGHEIQVTKDGVENKVINGASDWVYEEELVLVRAFEWSPDGQKIAYYRFDESEVKQFNMAIYNDLYPEDYRFKYPKAGEKNANVDVYIYSLNTQNVIKVKLNEYEYIPRIQWNNSSDGLAVLTTNRHQSQLTISIANVNTGEVSSIFTDESATYLKIEDNITFLEDGRFIWTSENSGYNQLYILDPKDNSVKQLTKGENEVTSYKGYNKTLQKFYYMSADKGDPTNRYLYAFDLKTGSSKKISQDMGFNRVTFSKGLRYYINYHSTANSPLKVTINDPSNGKIIRTIKDNEKLKTKMEEFGFANTEFFDFKTENGDQLNGWMIKPPNFDPSKKYPILMYVYGGPGSQTVKNSWGGSNYIWYQMLAKKGYIIASVDNRGTGARGNKFRSCTYKQLGKLETEDQISAAKYFGSLDYIDSKRIGIWGWSYGGYMTTLCMTKGADYFKTGIAVAPVSNWRFYDSIYTERYMQTPQENPDGYDDNSPINHVDKLKGKYLLVHGTADDNVHFQNTTELIQALVEAGKPFELGIYTDKNHGIGGGKTRLHLYQKMTRFIEDNL